MLRQRQRANAIAVLRLAGWVGALALATAGCRADVDGYWSGTIADERIFLSLEQAGSLVKGEGCVNGMCADNGRGDVVEERLEFTFGCDGCEGPSTTELDLSVLEGEMEGLAYVPGCLHTDESDECERVFTLRLHEAWSYEP